MSQQSLVDIFSKAPQQVSYLAKLMTYGREKGFQTFLNRKQIWPYLLGLDSDQLSRSIYEWDGQMDRNSPDFQQLQKDAQRALASMKTFQNITKFHLQKRQKDVLKVLDSFFAKNKDLRYIQGFHDVASIFLVLFGNSNGYYMMQKAGKTYFRDFLTRDIGQLGTLISDMVLQLLIQNDKQYEQIFECFKEMRLIIFIIPWVLTWFSHVFSSVKIICRIWDYILCTGPHGIIYLTAGIIMATKADLKQKCPDYEQPSIHVFYQEIAKKQQIDIEQAIKHAIRLEKTMSLSSLTIYSTLDKNSMFLSQNFQKHIDLHRQVLEYKKQQKNKKAFQKKVIAVVGTAIVVGFGVLFYVNKKKLGWFGL